MKTSKMCPKCQSTNIVMHEGYASDMNEGVGIIRVKPINYVPLDKYICCSCGYTEEGARQEDLAKIKDSKYSKRPLIATDL